MSGTEQFIPPIGISLFGYSCIHVDISFGIRTGRLQSLVYGRVIQTFINHFTALISIQGRPKVYGCTRKASTDPQCNFCTSYHPFLCCDQNHTVSCTRTIKRCSGSILYHRNIFNIGRIKRAHYIRFGIIHIGGIRTRAGSHITGSDRHTIDDKKWFIGCIE